MKPTRTELGNGLKVLLLESHQAPVASFHLWANVGSVDETDEEAGLCHLIEHMIFKGTSRRPVGEIARSVEAAGGDMNAYTSFDETVFYLTMPSKNLGLGLDILADASSDPTFDARELEREKEVVVEEISRAEDNPSQMATEDLFAKAFTVHPYRRPIAGTRETVRAVSRERLMEFFKRWYVGSNLILVGVGDFREKEILPKIEDLFGRIPAGQPPRQSFTQEPIPTAPRIVTRGMPVEGHYLDLGMPIPALTHPDVPGLDLLAQILGVSASSRLEQVVKEKKGLVISIGAFAYTPRHPSLFIVGAMLKDGRLKETAQAVRNEIDRLRQSPPSSLELARARENLRSSRVYEKQTAQGMARKLAFFEGIAGDFAFEEEYDRRLAHVTSDEVQELAQRYLVPDRLTLSFCHPQKETWRHSEIQSFLVPHRPPKPKTRPTGKAELIRLANGLRLVVQENHSVPLISIRAVSLGGIRFESRRTNGLSHLLSLLLTKGTERRSAREIAEASDNLSGHIDGYVGRSLIGLNGTFLSERLAEGFDLFCDLLCCSTLPEEEIRKEKARTQTAIRTEEDSLPNLVMKKFRERLYPNHPYGLPTLGTADSVRRLSRANLVRAMRTTIRPDNLVLAVVGDISADDLRARVREKLGPWRGPRVAFPTLPKPTPPAEPQSVITRRKRFQAHIVYGFLGTTVRNPDRYPLEVLNAILAGQGGRLFLNLRDKRGLAYAVSSSNQEEIEAGTFAIYMGTDPTKLDLAIDGIRKEIEQVLKEGVTASEIDRAKNYIVGNYSIDLQKAASVAALLAVDTILGLGPGELDRYPKEIEAVREADIERVARKYLRPEASVLSVIRP